MTESAFDMAARRKRQQKEALVMANKVRRVKRVVKEKLRAKEIDPIALVAGLDPEWSPVAYELKIGPILEAVPRLGPKTVNEMLNAAGFLATDRLAYKTKPEIDVLVELMRAVILHR